MASAQKLEDCTDNDIVCLSMPVKSADLLDTVQMMTHSYIRRKKRERNKPKIRTEQERTIINRAKVLLMDRNNMTEEEAHRYIQKTSMDSGTNIVEMAEMILSSY